jgi:hypothetical protein
MFFTFREDARGNAERQPIGEYQTVVGALRRLFQRFLIILAIVTSVAIATASSRAAGFTQLRPA